MRFLSSIYVSVALMWAGYAAAAPVPLAAASPASANDGPIIRAKEVTSTNNDTTLDVFEPIDVALGDADVEGREVTPGPGNNYCVIA
ncbi:hypothetical protein FB451DRAFT_1396629 [Mycena latifolia]|nr:hypothetical protein FB451DRAFT_1396629 [Mycena latifolia]